MAEGFNIICPKCKKEFFILALQAKLILDTKSNMTTCSICNHKDRAEKFKVAKEKK